ncbi:2-oxoglutarate dehydrogenase E1 component [Gammaproteobacteria bacterium]|nr:2-oxoglutarate dehydrogenase E1 component [Gammaproteobacteria bacterium]
MSIKSGSEWRHSLESLSGESRAYLEGVYEQFLSNPKNVSAEWQSFFSEMPSLPDLQSNQISETQSSADQTDRERKQGAVLRLINAYRTRGHSAADLDPLGIIKPEIPEDFSLDFQGLEESDLAKTFDSGSLGCGTPRLTLAEIRQLCEAVYCGPLGVEYMHITNTQEKRWLQERLEASPVRPKEDNEIRKHILQRLTAAEGLEHYLHKRFVGQKRFSLEGGETLIPALQELIQQCGQRGAKEIVIGMAHRGRLNVLVNILGKSPEDLFSEFEGKVDEIGTDLNTGDVKYHQGFSADIDTPGGIVHVALAFNPSHLEIIDPVVEGSVRARQDRRGDHEKDGVIPILIHGDAAFAGQGVVMETLNMSNTRGFSTGGTIHLIINNQIGFTTRNPLDARSTPYCTEIAKMVQAPIFHVNGDDPDAVLFVMRVAHDFRMAFHKDVVVDIICYRRLGHNEADEPAITQPSMYRVIRDMPTTRQRYAQRLVDERVIADSDANALVTEYRDAMDDGRVVNPPARDPDESLFLVDWTPYLDVSWTEPAETSIPSDRILSLNKKLITLPEGFEPHSRVARILADRDKMAHGELPMDWGFAETLAYASLIDDGYSVRLSGQDAGRGTFSHRHAVLKNQARRQPYVPLREIGSDPSKFLVIDSLLSEEAVLGFEYGYATTEPRTLTIWEAQFGDFANGAQVVIDQFISSGEAKWQRLCGLTLLLPHGLEGQGPEHSSARLERFLQLCGDDNMQVCVPTTPAQFFHLLRRQMIRPLRRPLIVMTPKSLLRHRQSVSDVSELSSNGFLNVIDDPQVENRKAVTRIVLCSGKVYFSLIDARAKSGDFKTAIIRIEQLYPFPQDQLESILKEYPKCKTVVWCQEEARNQGSWHRIQNQLSRATSSDQQLVYVSREPSASPAVGSHQKHVEQQEQLVKEALDDDFSPNLKAVGE